MGVIAVFGWVRSTLAVVCARIMGIDGVLNRGKYLLPFKLQVGREFYISMWHLALLFCAMALLIGPCKIANFSLCAAVHEPWEHSWI
jgi:hypothetical protein